MGKTPRRAAPARQHQLMADSSTHRELIKELLAICQGAAPNFGIAPLSPREFSTLHPAHKAHISRNIMKRTDLLCDAFADWAEKKEYCDRDLQPRPLPIFGPAPSFQALCAGRGGRGGRAGTGRLLQHALRLEMCRVNGSNEVVIRRRAGLFMGNRTLGLAFAVVCIERLLRTAAFNARRGRLLRDSMIHRSIWDWLSDKDFQKYRDWARHSVANVLRQQETWMLPYSQKKQNRKNRRVGVTAFLYRD